MRASLLPWRIIAVEPERRKQGFGQTPGWRELAPFFIIGRDGQLRNPHRTREVFRPQSYRFVVFWLRTQAGSWGSLHVDAIRSYRRSGGCSPIATHMRRARVNCDRFILRAAIVARPVAVRAVISVASLFHAKWSDHSSR